MSRIHIFQAFQIQILFFGFVHCSAQSSNLELTSPLVDDIRIYQNVLSSALGSNCRMYPSCSNYGIAVFEQKPAIMGFVKTSDRLMRCGNDLGNYKRIILSGETRIKDLPSESNLDSYSDFHYDWLEQACVEYKFICYLLELQRFDEALLEIHRMEYKFMFDGLKSNIELSYLEAYCYLSRNDLSKATSFCRDNLHREWDSHLAEILADCHVRSNQFENASRIYQTLIDSSDCKCPIIPTAQ